MERLDLTPQDLLAANIDVLAERFPHVVTEVQGADGSAVRSVDWDLLRQELSDRIVEGPQERYQLDWPGKRAAAFAANAPIAKTLRPAREESVDFATAEHLFVEGDNLDALKLLQESYLGKIKLIYIDPPYNTGHDFLYEDDFASTFEDYLASSGQRSGSGARLVTNVEANGRFHSDWLSMLFPRMRLARNLLTRDGVLAVSIDDNELARVLQMGQQVFGDNCVVNVVAVKSSEASGVKMSHVDRRLPKMKEYLIIFARSREDVRVHPVRVRKDAMETGELDKYLKYYGKVITNPEAPVTEWNIERIADVLTRRGVEPSAAAVRAFQLENAQHVVYRTNNASLASLEFPTATAEVVSPTGLSYVWWEGKQMLFLGDHLEETLGDLWTDVSTINLNKETLGVAGFGQGQKPLALIKRLLALFTVPGEAAVVLDFFAGSGTTGHAVVRKNVEDGGNRRFILVQLPEPISGSDKSSVVAAQTCDELGVPRTIAELAKERVRRAVTAPDVRAGLRVLKVDSSNMVDVLRTPEDVEQQALDGLLDSVRPDRTGEDLLIEVILAWGLDPAMAIHVQELEGVDVLVVGEDAVIGCFHPSVAPALVRAVARRAPLRAVFRDASFESDQARVNAEQAFRELSPSTDVRVI